MNDLKKIARRLVSGGKGILAADESTPTCTKRFESIGVKSTEFTRNEYRSWLFSTSNIEKYISGVILYHETFHQSIINTNISVPEFLKNKNILAGIKVDTGAKNFAGFSHEKITEGLDNLRLRLNDYKIHGAKFAKWRAVIRIGKNIPTKACIAANSHALARYAALCQETGIVPIVEPEILMEGDHNIQNCYKVTENVLKNVFMDLNFFNVDLEGIILKPNMILPGIKSSERISNEKIAELTFKCLKNNVPSTVPGIAFLSGGQKSDDAAARLNLINKIHTNKPWKLSFSYGRALQEDALTNYSLKDKEKVKMALIKRAKLNHLATLGKLD